MKVLFSDPKEKVVIKEINPPELKNHQVRIKTAYSYISAGTELTFLQMGGNVNFAAEMERQPLGYSLAGQVIEVGKNVTHVKTGDAVCCIGEGAYHSTEVVVAKNLLVPVPPGVDLREAAPMAMMCFALEGVRKARLEFGENVLIVGGGLMGQFTARFAGLTAGKIFLMDNNEHRLKNMPAGVIPVKGDDKGWELVAGAVEPAGIETAFICLGGEATSLLDRLKTVMSKSPDGLCQGRVVFSGGASVTVEMASASGNLRFLSSAKAGAGYRDPVYEAGADYPIFYVRWPVRRNMEVILKAIASKKLSVKPLITHEYHYTEALGAYNKLSERNTDAMAVLLRYDRI